MTEFELTNKDIEEQLKRQKKFCRLGISTSD